LILKGQSISFDKELMPPYIINFNVFMLAFFAGCFVIYTPAIIAAGVIYGEATEFYIVLGSMFGAFLIGVLILYTVALKLRERLVSERAAELEEKFSDMPFDEAEEILRSGGVIT